MEPKFEKSKTIFPNNQTLWNWLIFPHPSVNGIAARQQVSHSAGFALTTILFNFLGTILTIQYSDKSLALAFAISLIFAIVAYFIIKSRYFLIGSFILISGTLVLTYLCIYIGKLDTNIGILGIVPLILVIATVFTSAWGILILTGLNLAGLLYLSVAGIRFPVSNFAISGLMAAFGLILIYISSFWKNIVEIQNFELNKTNLESNEIRNNLQKRVEERTVAIDRRAARLEAAAMVTKAAAEIRDLHELLNTITLQISERFGFYHVGIFMADENYVQMNLVAASSSGGQRMLARGHKLAIGREGIVGFAAQQKRSRIAQSVGLDVAFFNNPDLPNTRSEAALPLLAQDRIIGVLDIQSEEENAFVADDISILQTMTDQIALAIENIRLVEQSRLTLQNLENINSNKISKAWIDRFGNRARGFIYTPLGIKPLTENSLGNSAENNDERTLQLPLLLHGKNIGELSLTRKSKELTWSVSEREMAQEVATQVALALENARLLEESQSRAVREQTIGEFSNQFSRSLDIDTLLQNAVKEIYRLPQVSQVSLYVTPAEENKKSEK